MEESTIFDVIHSQRMSSPPPHVEWFQRPNLGDMIDLHSPPVIVMPMSWGAWLMAVVQLIMGRI
jgi:hypothetical protein